ncbi:AAA family ATPase [Streptomyces goshikiensis]|uniref:AAA family ATPase n=1 Tax=Streptomyces goshikiensis TaxID=1942 RepID=UPI00370FA99D
MAMETGQTRRGDGRGSGLGFVGREMELGVLMESLSGGPAVVFVEGEAGVGKSRLVSEVADRMSSRGVPVLMGGCNPLREPLPFGPAIDALRDACRLLPPDAELSAAVWALRPFLPELADRVSGQVSEPVEKGRHLLMRAVQEVLSAMGPVVLVVEDVHWADEATRELLSLLARHPSRDLRLVITYRTQDLGDDAGVLGSPYKRPVGIGGKDIALAPLSEAHVRELAVSVLGEVAAAALGRHLFERSGGLPLVAEEDLLLLSDRMSQPGGWNQQLEGVRVPRALQEAVSVRVSGLAPEALSVVQAAAVLAVPAAEELVAAVARLGEEEAEEGLVEALEASVLVETAPGRYGFRHVLARQAVYAVIAAPRRRRLHARAVAALEAQDPPALVQIAHHTRLLGDVRAWIPRALAAADRAREVGDDGIAAELLRQLLAEVSLPATERTRAALALARIAHYSVDYASNAVALRRIMADPLLPVEVRGEIRLGLGLFLINQGGDWKGNRELEQAVTELAGHPAQACRAMVALARGEPDLSEQEALAWMERAERVAIDVPERAPRAAVWATRLDLMALDGDPDVWLMLDQLPRQDDDREVLRQYLRALNNCGCAAMERGYDERASELLKECQELCMHAGFGTMEIYSRTGLLILDWLGGRWEGLEDRLAALSHKAPDMIPPAKAAVQIGGNLAAARGQWSRALEEFNRAALMEEQFAEKGEVLCAVAGIAQVRLAQGDPEAAWAIAGEALDPVPAAPRAWANGLATVAVQAALACGESAAARDLVASVYGGIHNKEAPAVTAGEHLAQGMILEDEGDLDAASTNFDQAHRIWTSAGRLYQAAQAGERLARAGTPRAPQDAARQLTRIAALYTGLGATADASRCERNLREMGVVTRSPSRGPRGYGAHLSPRESQVVRLLTEGATNQDIAQALSLSPRTVEHHVASALKKLGVSRAAVRELAAMPPTEGS